MKATHCPTCKRKYKTSDKAKAYRKALRAEKQEKAEKHRMSTGEIREAVMERAQGRCEAGVYHTGWLEMDHWLGGGGRRRVRQSVETCWVLCCRCHSERSLNYPSAAHWNDVFKWHCDKYGYPFTPHIEKQPLPKRSA